MKPKILSPKQERAARNALQEMRDLHDLPDADRDWARGVSALARISLHDAAMRIRRIRYDARLLAVFLAKVDELGSGVIVTNVEHAGPDLERIDVSIMPAPVTVRTGAVEQHLVGTEAASQAMRVHVARHEVTQAFGHRARTALPELMGSVLAAMVPPLKRPKPPRPMTDDAKRALIERLESEAL